MLVTEATARARPAAFAQNFTAAPIPACTRFIRLLLAVNQVAVRHQKKLDCAGDMCDATAVSELLESPMTFILVFTLSVGIIVSFWVATILGGKFAEIGFPLPQGNRFAAIDGLRGYLALGVRCLSNKLSADFMRRL